MEFIKSYTDINQSKRSAEILPLESADMCINSTNPYALFTEVKPLEVFDDEHDPYWSLAALLDVLPNNEHIGTSVSRGGWQIEPINYLPNTWWCEYEDCESLTEFNVSAKNPVDACVAMIEKLHELNLL